MTKKAKNLTLPAVWSAGLRAVHPRALLEAPGVAPRAGEAVLCWGKAAAETWRALRARYRAAGERAPPALVLSLETGEHPLPGPGSLEGGRAILEFFDSLRRRPEVRGLRVYLSGGASSLAWVPPAGLGLEALKRELVRLYRAPLTIEALNRRRARLCALKSGGAARWLDILAPGLPARVEVISDVHPFGPGVVGSGPFRDRDIPHHVLADNPCLLSALAKAARRAGIPVLEIRSGLLAPWRDWVGLAEAGVKRARRKKNGGLILLGGEPRVRLPARAGRGGRQTQLAGALALRLQPWLAEGRLEVLCMSSDGVDGNSGASGARLDARLGRRLGDAAERARLTRALGAFDAAAYLAGAGALMHEAPTGTNVQDAVLLWVKAEPS